jgi:uncharacterized caspase-like protein
MAKNWAIVIGINGYTPTNFQPLRYAKRDAELVRDFFLSEAGFDEVCCFTDDSSAHVENEMEIPTYPSRGHLMSFLHDRFEHPFLESGDNCWCFFAGHGQRIDNRDYLMPIDANPRMPDSGIAVNHVRERLLRSGSDNVILLLDACRNDGRSGEMGIGQEPQQGVITISSCRPTQRSYEIDDLQQGAFTYALLEALRLPGERNCATVERLDQYLRSRVPQLCDRYDKLPVQNPATATDPKSKNYFILLPDLATVDDITKLKNEILQASFDDNLEFAEQLCIRAIAAARGRDLELLNLLVKIRQRLGNEIKQASSNQSRAGNVVIIPDAFGNPIELPVVESQAKPKSTPPEPILQKPIDAIPLESENKIDYRKIRELMKTVARFSLLSDFELPQIEPKPKSSQPVSLPQDPIDAIPLESEKKVDYRKLRDLLKAGKWEEADRETLAVMLQTAKRKSDGWLDEDSLKRFPCKDLRTIDQLWVTASNGHFGFSVQKRIWEEYGSPMSTGKDWDRFCVRLGWKDATATYMNYSNLIKNPSISSAGELPLGFLRCSSWVSPSFFLGCLFPRTKACEL